MNNKGQILGIAIVAGIVFFIVGMMLINIIKPEVTTARGNTGLDCSNTSITSANKASCLAVDLVVPIFIVSIISAAGGLVVARLLL